MTPREIFNIVQLAYYVPVLILGILVCLRHGFGRSDGWIYIVILALLRLIGSSTGIAYVYNQTNLQLLACEIVCSTIGLSPLLIALLGFTGRIGRSAVPSPPVKPIVMRGAYLPITIALVFGILAGKDGFSSDPSKVDKAHLYAKVTAILYLLSYLGAAAIIAVTFKKRYTIRRADNKLMYAGMLVLPFLGVRVLYGIIASFDYTDTNTFSLYKDADRPVLIQGLLAFMMEVFVTIIYITAAMLTPRPNRDVSDSASEDVRHSEAHMPKNERA